MKTNEIIKRGKNVRSRMLLRAVQYLIEMFRLSVGTHYVFPTLAVFQLLAIAELVWELNF